MPIIQADPGIVLLIVTLATPEMIPEAMRYSKEAMDRRGYLQAVTPVHQGVRARPALHCTWQAERNGLNGQQVGQSRVLQAKDSQHPILVCFGFHITQHQRVYCKDAHQHQQEHDRTKDLQAHTCESAVYTVAHVDSLT